MECYESSSLPTPFLITQSVKYGEDYVACSKREGEAGEVWDKRLDMKYV